MNDRHPSGPHYPAGTADDVGHPDSAYPGFSGGWAPGHGGHPQGTDPFGGAAGAPPYGPPDAAPPPYGPPSPYGQDPYGQATAYGDGRHETTAWDSTPAHGIPRYDPAHAHTDAHTGYGGYGQVGGGYGQVGGYGETHGHGGDGGYGTGGFPASGGYADAGWDTSNRDTAGWDTGAARTDGWQVDAWSAGGTDAGGHASGRWDTGGWDSAPAHAYAAAGGWDTPGLADWETTTTTRWTPAGHGGTGYVPTEPAWHERAHAEPGDAVVPEQATHPRWQETGWQETGGYAHSHTEPLQVVDDRSAGRPGEVTSDLDRDDERPHHPGALGASAPADLDEHRVSAGQDGFPADPQTGHGADGFVPRSGHSPDDVAPLPPRRGRRSKPKRSALLTVAAPSLCVLGVTAVAASAITTPGTDEPAQSEEDLPLAAEEPVDVTPVDANQEFDTQLQSLTAAADDYADRASRTQGRMDLEEREAEEQRLAEEEAARKEAERPKHALPVEQRGLSMRYNQPGLQYVGLHTGIDFPVSEGTPVYAATDGTVRTQTNHAYGNMAIVTAPDGTETWYAHLSSTVVQAGEVQAGTVIAYSGNTGNSFGPHLHFEVRPGGGSHVDPTAWLRARGLEPEY